MSYFDRPTRRQPTSRVYSVPRLSVPVGSAVEVFFVAFRIQFSESVAGGQPVNSVNISTLSFIVKLFIFVS